MQKSIAIFFMIILPLLASADAGDYFRDQVDVYFASHGLFLPSDDSGVQHTNWNPTGEMIVSNVSCHAVVAFETNDGTNRVPSSIELLDGENSRLGIATVKRFGTQRNAWSSLGMEIVASSVFATGYFDKYASTNLSPACSIFLPLDRSNDAIIGTNQCSATILSGNLRVDIESSASLAPEIAITLAESLLSTVPLDGD